MRLCTNKKSIAVTVNDLEPHLGRLSCVISLKAVAHGANYVKLIEAKSIMSATAM